MQLAQKRFLWLIQFSSIDMRFYSDVPFIKKLLHTRASPVWQAKLICVVWSGVMETQMKITGL